MPWKLFKMWNRIYTIHILAISITFVESVQCRYAEIVHVCARCTFQRDQDELQRIFQSVRIASEQTLYKMYLLQNENFLKIIIKMYLRNKVMFDYTTESVCILRPALAWMSEEKSPLDYQIAYYARKHFL